MPLSYVWRTSDLKYLNTSEYSSGKWGNSCLTIHIVGEWKAPITVAGTEESLLVIALLLFFISHLALGTLSKPKHKALQKLLPGCPQPPFSLSIWTAGSRPHGL